MKRMKRMLLPLVVLAAMMVPSVALAQTAKALWCSGNATLYFVYDTETYTASSSTYDGQTITAVYNINLNSTNIPWTSIRTSVKTVDFQSSFKNCQPKKLTTWFSGFTALTEVKNIGNLDTSAATSMNNMFYNCLALTTLDVSNWNVSKVTDMRSMFSYCRALTTIGDVSNWDVSKVTDMSFMFNYCNALTTIGDVSNWNVSKVTEMTSMFQACQALTTIGDVSNWVVSSVTSMTSMFSGCYVLTPLDVSKWNVSSVTAMNAMFLDCRALTTLDVSNWNVSNVTNMGNMFSGCNALTTIGDVSNWNTSSVTNMSYMFGNCNVLTTLGDVSNWNVSSVTNMTNMFSETRSSTHYTFGDNFTMGNVTSAKNMFYRKDIDLQKGIRYIDFYNSASANKNASALKSVNRSNYNNTFNGVAQTAVIYLPKGSNAVTDVVNVVYSHDGDETDLRCPHYYSEDQVDIELPRSFKTNKAEYTRGIKAGTNYGTVILPYKFKSNDEVQAYTLTKEYTDIMYFVEADEVPAHTPFFFAKKIKNAEEVKFVMEDTSGNFGITVEATRSTNAAETTWDDTPGAPYTDDAQATQLEGWSTKGYYVKQYEPDYNGAFYINGDKFYKASGELTLYPHRVTFHGTWTQGTPVGTSNVYNIRTLSDRDVALGIKEAETRKTLREASDVYDILGRRHDTPQKGLNIVRGQDGVYRKVFVK